MSPAPEGTCSVTRGAFRTYSPYPSPGQAKGIKLLSRLVAIVNRLTAGWHWQAVDDLTELERWPRRTPSLSVGKCVAPSQGICVIRTVRTRTLSKGRPSGRVPGLPDARRACEQARSLAMFWCWRFPSWSWLTLAGSVAPLNAQGLR